MASRRDPRGRIYTVVIPRHVIWRRYALLIGLVATRTYACILFERPCASDGASSPLGCSR
ncbi:hypothetical protein CP532_3498 [Ophiocordyceps camponoti-leonardi (nom. inval.)]|nr:hypothetical protein CP532_3498 [Ophiocordyceps camponoti-leonardi (nom. inval.)]